jgi:PPOX class probable FMN-dependent enzyme
MLREIPDVISSEAELLPLFGTPAATSIRKEVPALTPSYRKMIQASPFVAVATCAPEGLDCSPRGDPAGFVRIVDDKTLMIPQRRGNQRVDTLRNLVRDPRIALLFLIPGIAETLRVNGRGVLTRNEAIRDSFAMNGKAPDLVIVVHIETVYFQCARALVRSKLWDPANFLRPGDVPTAGAILAEVTNGEEGGDIYDRQLPGKIKETLY